MQWLKSIMLVGIVIIVAFGSAYAGDFPLAYPYNAWGEVSHGPVDGLKFDAYAEQGIDLFKIPGTDWVIDTFGGARITQSQRAEDTWNNKFGPIVGMKLKHDFSLLPGSWQQVSVGIRGEYLTYNSGSRTDEFQGIVFFSFGFGGKW